MQLKPLICPQCGGEITNYSPGQTFATCSYCSTRFVIDAKEQEKDDVAVPVLEEIDDSPTVNSNQLVTVVVVVFCIITGIVIIGSLASISIKSTSSTKDLVHNTAASPRGTPQPVPNPNLLELRGQG